MNEAVEPRVAALMDAQGVRGGPAPAARAEDWRILAVLGPYRLLLVTTLLTLYRSGLAPSTFEQIRQPAFYYGCLTYALIALFLLLLKAFAALQTGSVAMLGSLADTSLDAASAAAAQARDDDENDITLRQAFVVYSLAALLCPLAPTVEWLIALRFAMGFSGAAGLVVSRAVVREWMSGLASFSNCRVRNQPCLAASSCAFTTMPKPRCACGVSTTLAPRKRSSLRRSTLKLSAMVTTSG